MAQADPDFLYRFLFEQFPVRGELIHVNAAWQELLNRADYPAPVAQVLGEALAATALLAASIKLEGRLTLQIQSEGPLSLLVVQCDRICICVAWPVMMTTLSRRLHSGPAAGCATGVDHRIR